MTNPSTPLRTLACPSCGAPLEIIGNEPTIHCKFCSAVIENPEYRPPQPVKTTPVVPIQINVERPTYRPTPVQTPRRANRLVSIIVVLGMAIGAIILIMVFNSNANNLGGGSIGSSLANISPLQIDREVLMLNTDGGSPNVIATTYGGTSDLNAISRLDLGTHKALWSALGQKESLKVDALIAGDTLLYVVMEDHLLALSLSDGKQAWESSLPDKLSGSCKQCLLLKKGQVIVLTTDNSLTAYDAATGHQTWEKRFDSIGDTLYPVGDSVALVYSVKNGATLSLFDAATGAEGTPITPTCEAKGSIMEDQMETYSNILIDNSSQPVKAYTFFGLFNACVQRWDLASGKMDWSAIEPDQNLDNSREEPILLGNGTLNYIQDYQLRSLDTATGTVSKTLDDTKDYSLVPLMIDGQRLIIRATRTRGSTRYELWAYDLTSGKSLWKRPILKSGPIDSPGAKSGLIDSDESGWALRQTKDGLLWLLTFQVQPNQVNVAQVNPDTGDLANQKNISLGIDNSTDFYDIPIRLDSFDKLSWFAMLNRIYAFDPAAGTVSFRWP